MEDNLNQNGRRPHPKWKTTSPKLEDDLTQIGRRPYPKWKMTKDEDDQKLRQPKIRTAKIESYYNLYLSFAYI